MSQYPTQAYYPHAELTSTINAECQLRKQQVFILYIIGLTRPGTQTPDLLHSQGLRATVSATVPGSYPKQTSLATALVSLYIT